MTTTSRPASPRVENTGRRNGGSRQGAKPTINDVARLASVSTATVSYVLNGHLTEVSTETAQRVMKAVAELGYVKNLAAAALTGKKSRMIAVIIPGIYDHESASQDQEINPFYGEFAFRLESQARARGYAVCVYGGREKDFVHFLLERGVEAAVLVGLSEWDLPDVLRRQDIHCVMFDSFNDDARHSHVRTNEMKGGYLAAERLIDLGRKKIVFVGGTPAADSSNVPSLRYRGARKACEMADLPMQNIEALTSYDAGLHAAEQVVALGADGVVTTADIIAAGLLEGLQRRGARVPDDIAVMGYDNLPISRFTKPRLSTIDQGLNEKVKAVIELISKPQPGTVRVIDPKLVLRESA
jgi:LacI family transcriptional regulator